MYFEVATLQSAFYIVSIVFMSFIMLLGLILLVALLVVKSKIKAKKREMKDKFKAFTIGRRMAKGFWRG